MSPTATSSVTAARLSALVGAPDADRPVYQWLSDAIRTLLADGRLLHGTRLPSERVLVDALGLSRTTVSRAYAELREKGYVVARHGSGTVAVLPGGPVAGGGEPMPLGSLTPAPDGTIDFTTAAPAAAPGLSAAYAAAGERLSRYLRGMGYYPLGLPDLREAIAARYDQRGLPTSADQIIVTTGAVEGTAAAARVLLGRGSRVLVESPGYPNMLATIRREASRLEPVPVTWAGSDLPAWESAMRGSAARVALLIPDFHNPTGSLLDADRRERLARLWRQHEVTGVIDETVAEVVLDEVEMPPPMAAAARDAITVSSMSKTAWGGMRIGWLRAPQGMVPALAQARMTLGLGAPVLEQLAAAEVLTRITETAHERRESLRAQRCALDDGIRAALPEWECEVPAGGLSLWWRLPAPRSSALVRAAAREGLVLAAGSSFAVTGSGLEHWVRTPYALPADTLALAVPRLARAWAAAA